MIAPITSPSSSLYWSPSLSFTRVQQRVAQLNVVDKKEQAVCPSGTKAYCAYAVLDRPMIEKYTWSRFRLIPLSTPALPHTYAIARQNDASKLSGLSCHQNSSLTVADRAKVCIERYLEVVGGLLLTQLPTQNYF